MSSTLGIIWVHEKHEAWSGLRNDKGDYEFSRAFDVLTQTRNVGPFQVLLAEDPTTGLAVPGDFDDYHAGDDAVSFAYVRSKEAKRDQQQPLLWNVDVRYSTATETQQRQVAENPLDRPAVYSWDNVQYQKVARKDVEGAPIKNSAGERFNPAPEIDDSRPVLRVERNEVSFNEARAIDYQDAVNTDMFHGFDPGKAKVAKIAGTSEYENSVHYWKVVYEIHFRREGWLLSVLDEGTFYLSGGEKKLFKDAQGQFLHTGLLNGSGGQAAVGYYTFINFYVYKERPFNVMGI